MALAACASSAPRPEAPATPPADPPRSHQETAAPWAEGLPEPVEPSSLDVVVDEHLHYELVAFAFDPQRIEAWRYDACVRARQCPPRQVAQPSSARLAVGMSWDGAADFCTTRGMRVQSAQQDVVIQDHLDERPEPLLAGQDPEQVVVYGFRCVARPARLSAPD